MRIGIVCEGPTDYPAITCFLGDALRSSGVSVKFDALYPDMDNTRPEGGWSNVFSWIKKYPAESRVQKYFDGGFFGGSLSSLVYDAILFHLDTDILGDPSFATYVQNQYGIIVSISIDPVNRAAQISQIIIQSLNLDSISNNDASKHIDMPAVESTENWCVAAFSAKPENREILTGGDLVTSFMRALEISESREPKDSYSNIDKTLHRRIKFCELHAKNFDRITRDCVHFGRVVDRILLLYK